MEILSEYGIQLAPAISVMANAYGFTLIVINIKYSGNKKSPESPGLFF